MLVPVSWLRSFVDVALDPETLAHQLTMAGLEVEDVHRAAPEFTGVVVGEILNVVPHPNADRLRVCTVSDGTDSTLQIVCGAPNAAVGLKVPLAKVGAQLPGDFTISPVKMRGVDSAGMLCSAKELGISEESAGLLELPANSVVGQCLRQALDLDEAIFEIKMTPNRADCLSMLGVAREVAALTGLPLQQPSYAPVEVRSARQLPVHIQAPDLCGRFAGRVITGVNAKAATPEWMVQRLERAGQRSLSALVDISNYVMLELGRPSHIFDLNKLDAQGLEVRWARDGEQVELLSGKALTLNPQVGVIAANGHVESLAGIMGGERTAVTLDTTDIYVESAFWWPEAIMGRARQFKFSSDASYRYERGVDFEHLSQHLERISQLILEICGGQAGPIDEQTLQLPSRDPVAMRLQRCHRVLGVQVSAEEVTQIFTALGFAFRQDGDVFYVTPPSYRFDLRIEEDLIEEVARIYGFERIPDVPPKARAYVNVLSEHQRSPHALREALAALDYQEVINFAFVEENWEKTYHGNSDPIRLLNPIASQLAVMRSSLIAGLLANIEHNAKHRQSRVRVFELGRVFRRDTQVKDGDQTVAGVSQPTYIAGAAWGPVVPEQWGVTRRTVDFYDVKNDVENLFGQRAADLRFEPVTHPALHPGRSAAIYFNDQRIGLLGELHPQVARDFDLATAPVVFELQAEILEQAAFPQVAHLSRQPVVQRDLAVWVATQIPYQALVDSLRSGIQADAALAIVQDIQLFDVWRDPKAPHEQSLALRVWLQDAQNTLDDSRVDATMQQLLAILVQQHGARLRD